MARFGIFSLLSGLKNAALTSRISPAPSRFRVPVARKRHPEAGQHGLPCERGAAMIPFQTLIPVRSERRAPRSDPYRCSDLVPRPLSPEHGIKRYFLPQCAGRLGR